LLIGSAGIGLALLLGVIGLSAAAGPGFDAPGAVSEEAAVAFEPVPSGPSTPLADAIDRLGQQLKQLPWFAGVAQGRNPIGDDAIVVYITRQGFEDQVPAEFDGFPVRTEVVPGGFEILPAR
jgi:hypothetical protein